MQPFASRPVGFHGLREPRGWRLKVYSILYGDGALDWKRFHAGLILADAELPQPARSPGRPGLGFVIAHQGRTADYVVLAWWDQENELPLRVFVRTGDEGTWRPARGGESVCVWDLEVVWAEREAYVATMMRTPPDPAAWIARVLEHA